MLNRLLSLFSKPDPIFIAEVERLERVPENLASLGKADAIAALRKLATRQPSSSDELSVLCAESVVLSDRIKKSEFFRELPYGIQHYLSDADIRYKDKEYGARQTSEMLRAVEEWESK